MFEFLLNNKKFEPFDGLLVFSLAGILIDILLIFHFCMAWRIESKKTGWKIDFWFVTIFMTFFLNLLLAYPFMASPINNISIGQNNEIVYQYVDLAFYISIAGYISLWIGRLIFDISSKYNPLYVLLALARPFEKVIESNINSSYGNLMIFGSFLLANSVIIVFQVASGNIFDSRNYFLQNPQIRPLYNLVVSIYPFTSTFIAARIVQKNLLVDKILLVLGVVLSATLGSRYVILTVFINLISLYAYKRYKEIKALTLLKIFVFGLFLILVALYISDVRELQFNPLITFSKVGLSIFYGNTYSDIRDFAWILSKWDFNYLNGISYLSALFSFIPSTLSPLRGESSISSYTNNVVGFDSSLHSGLRPGMFGEAFMNFGILGPLLLGIIVGFCLRYSDKAIKKAVISTDNVITGYSKTFAYTVASSFYITAGFWSLYVYIILNSFVFLLNNILFKRKKISLKKF
jgi:oligosaccharide repeat unit polymerase